MLLTFKCCPSLTAVGTYLLASSLRYETFRDHLGADLSFLVPSYLSRLSFAPCLRAPVPPQKIFSIFSDLPLWLFFFSQRFQLFSFLYHHCSNPGPSLSYFACFDDQPKSVWLTQDHVLLPKSRTWTPPTIPLLIYDLYVLPPTHSDGCHWVPRHAALTLHSPSSTFKVFLLS